MDTHTHTRAHTHTHTHKHINSKSYMHIQHTNTDTDTVATLLVGHSELKYWFLHVWHPVLSKCLVPLGAKLHVIKSPAISSI